MTTPALTPWRILSLLLDYPDESLRACEAELAAAARGLPASPARAAILAHLERRERKPAIELQREYVECFDFSQRSTLYLGFHVHGDRRQRGTAMVGLKRAYHEAGFALDDGTLPDHLPAILELADLAPATGERVLAEFRPALEAVRAALHEAESDYALLLDAVCALLPAEQGPIDRPTTRAGAKAAVR